MHVSTQLKAVTEGDGYGAKIWYDNYIKQIKLQICFVDFAEVTPRKLNSESELSLF